MFSEEFFSLFFFASLAIILAFVVQHSSPPEQFKLLMRVVKSSFLCSGSHHACVCACATTSMYHPELLLESAGFCEM